PGVAKRHLDRVEVPPDGLEHNFGRRRVYWLENSIFKAPHFAVDQSRRRRVKSLEQFISASRRSSCPKDPRNWLRAITDRHDTPPGGRCALRSARIGGPVAYWQILLQKPVGGFCERGFRRLTRFAAEASDDGAAETRA